MSFRWAPAALSLSSSRLTLRLPSDEEHARLAGRARGNILGEHVDFLGAWAQLPAGEFEHGMVVHRHALLGALDPAGWTLNLAVFARGHDGAVGVQGISAREFAASRTVSTGSWLLADAQGAGLGSEMRDIALEFAFRGLGALVARTSAHEANVASRTVTERLGYRPDGAVLELGSAGRPFRTLRYRLDVADRRPRPDVRIDGLGPQLLALLTAPGAVAAVADSPGGEHALGYAGALG